ncbi:LemA family protein [Paludicola sp. MB14-C6]|uniref:LemA family protein n=1 Tax=Paludihabitans sp. MB14-C6 TaxID=3070656 RepID=UPI0027DE303F|nr:LemA family protein [Paludicola sp. MB14-C6]WMJ24189.1 LemA family protein [Paludicola sp. MB14-C6]
MIGWLIGGAIVLILVFWFIGGYNSFVKLKNKVEESFGAMDVFLKKRYDLIPNFVETVKGYAKHESETLEKVIAARNMAANSTTMEQQIENENVLQGTLKSLFALSEAYPDLKANANFLSLQNKLNEIETEIERSRRFYNAIVAQYNTKTEMFPSNIIANMFGFKRKPLYEITDTTQRENVKVQF